MTSRERVKTIFAGESRTGARSGSGCRIRKRWPIYLKHFGFTDTRRSSGATCRTISGG